MAFLWLSEKLTIPVCFVSGMPGGMIPGSMVSGAPSIWQSSALSSMRYEGKGKRENNLNRSTCRGNCTRGTNFSELLKMMLNAWSVFGWCVLKLLKIQKYPNKVLRSERSKFQNKFRCFKSTSQANGKILRIVKYFLQAICICKVLRCNGWARAPIEPQFEMRG